MRFVRFFDRNSNEWRRVSLEGGDVYKTRSKVYDAVRYEGNRLIKCGRCSLSRMGKVCKRIDCNNIVLVERD